jgi:hypothetical protein
MRHVFLLCCSLSLLLCACGGPKTPAAVPATPDLDRDPLALLPASAIAVASIVGHPAAPDPSPSPTAVAVTAAAAQWFVPVADGAGFQPADDVDRVVLGAYAMDSADVVAVLSGRFDPDRLAAATQSRYGTPVEHGTYAGFTTFTVGGVTFAPLTRRTILSGMGEGLRRALDRVRDGKIERAMPPWVVETVETKGSARLAAAADFSSQPIASVTLGMVRLPWLEGLRVARVLGDFEAPGLNVAGTLTYGTDQQSQAGVAGMRTVAGLLDRLSPLIGGIKLQNFSVNAAGPDLQCKFSVDDRAVRAALALAARFMPAVHP